MHVVHDSGFLPKPVPGEGYIFMCNFGFVLSLSFVIKKKMDVHYWHDGGLP